MYIQYDLKRINKLKEILLLFRQGRSLDLVKADFEQSFKDVSLVDVLLIELELINGDYGITTGDVEKFSSILPQLFANEEALSSTYPPNHPIQIFKEENTAFQYVLTQINLLLESIEREDTEKADRIEQFKQHLFQLGDFHNHLNRKEKIFFPILERYGNYAHSTRIVWRKDDRIRAYYKACKNHLKRHPQIDFAIIQKTFDLFQKELKETIFQEEAIILPLLQSIFSEQDWLAVANESDAFGYAIIEAPEEKWKNSSETKEGDHLSDPKLVYGGGGFLTTEEATLILNNLPLEITFVDRTNLFKYYNEITKDASEMMLVRTPSSIGRNVANCHPPKSLKKVMTLFRDLKTGKRKSESMWIKMKGKYVHITYKGIFDDEGEFLGVLEYVQDIQPFFELPTEVKRGLSPIEEE